MKISFGIDEKCNQCIPTQKVPLKEDSTACVNPNVLPWHFSLSLPSAGHLVRSAQAFRWRRGRQRHPGLWRGTASHLKANDLILEGLVPLPDGLGTLRAEWLRAEPTAERSRGGERSPEQEKGGHCSVGRQGEERKVSGCRPTGPRTPTDWNR